MIKSIIFDIGNVLIPFDFSRALRRLQPKCAHVIAERTDLTAPLVHAYEKGEFTRAEFAARVSDVLQYSGSAAEFVEIWQDIFTENVPMTELVASLRNRYPLYLLSNTSDLHVDYFTNKYPVFQYFSGAVYSYIEKCMKPGPEIFETTIRKFNIVSSETVYIDDLPANVQGALDLGFVAIQYDFNRHAEFLEELKATGVQI